MLFFFSSRRRHTRFDCDWSSDVCSSDLGGTGSGHSLEHSDGLQDLASTGSGEGHSLTASGFDLKVSAVSVGGGVSQQGSGIAGSFAVEVFVDHTHATIADGAQINQRALFTPTSGQNVIVQAEDKMHTVDVAGALGGSLNSPGLRAAGHRAGLCPATPASVARR